MTFGIGSRNYGNGLCARSHPLAETKEDEISPLKLWDYLDNAGQLYGNFTLHGSKSDSGRTGCGIFMKTSTGEFRYRYRNPDHSSVLIAISEALSLALDFKVPDVWILTDTKYDAAYRQQQREAAKKRFQRALNDWKTRGGDTSSSSTTTTT
ncbi:hypothetical protein CEXT_264551 [Caerostris extrusa]|uniref:RNase H type-1 domain-containing protein n=1 Tax=Caerostris extrusa TaxID=172846 RepID=A0AAV4RBP7_CAEEX|nr:hypothetical protein CEXT_264551 [Caerostris extrusa]